jgi:hypothetical protein
MTTQEKVDLWRKIITGMEKSWVLFNNDTCLILMQPSQDLSEQATEIMKEFGPVHVGSPSGDFGVIKLKGEAGWVVHGHHPDMLTYVSPQELGAEATDLTIGMKGRNKRDMDGRDPMIIHIEDKRPRKDTP